MSIAIIISTFESERPYNLVIKMYSDSTSAWTLVFPNNVQWPAFACEGALRYYSSVPVRESNPTSCVKYLRKIFILIVKQINYRNKNRIFYFMNLKILLQPHCKAFSGERSLIINKLLFKFINYAWFKYSILIYLGHL